MSLVNIVIAFTGLLTVAIAYVLKKYSFWADRDVPHIPPSFPSGNFAGVGRKYCLHEILQKVYTQLKPTHAKFAGVYFFITPTVLVLDLDFAKTVLIKDFEYFHDRGLYNNVKDDPLTGHLFVLEGQKWKKLRNKLTPAFTSGKMKFMFPTIVAVAQQFRTTIGQIAAQEDAVNIRDLLARFTTDVIGTCAFGIECNSLKDPDAEFRKYGKKIFGESLALVKMLLAAQFQSLARAFGVKVLKDDITKFFLGVVETTIAAREAQNIKRNDFLNMMIDMKNDLDPENQLTVREIAAQAFVFFVAGFETSSSAISFALFELAQNEDLQDKARESVQTALERHNGEMTYEAIMEMTYLSQCINESLRKYPPATNILRKVTKDYAVASSNVILPKGTQVFLPVYAIHHDPELYHDPEVYDPDRFTPENESKRPAFSYLPFGDGPRNCIGMRFGLMQSRVGLAMLLNSFKFKLSDKTTLPLDFVKNVPLLQPVSDIWLKVEKN